MKEEYGRSLQILLSVVSLVLLMRVPMWRPALARGVARRGKLHCDWPLAPLQTKSLRSAHGNGPTRHWGGCGSGFWFA